jgi:hypothetical protein
MLLFSGKLPAAEVAHLYDAVVPVTDQTVSVRKQAIQQALVRVMIKVSGNAQIAASDGISALLKKANNYVREYRYQKAEIPPPAEPQSELWVRFSSKAINSGLRELRLPVWGRARPATLVWLAYDDRGKRALLNGSEHPEIKQMIDDAAEMRGLPLVWPLLDLEDQSKISFSDIWAGFPDRILGASQRYQSEAILAGRLLHRANGSWDARWRYISAGVSRVWESSGSLSEVMPVGIDNTANELAQRYARRDEASSSQVRVKINDVNSAGAYESSLRFLHGLEPVEDIQLVSLDVDSVVFNLRLRGSENDLMQSIELSDAKLLLPVVSQPEQPGLVKPNPDTTVPPVAQTPPETLTFRFLK